MLAKITTFTQGDFYQNPIVHAIVTAIVFIIPLVISRYSALDTITIGSILRGVSQWLETRPAPVV